ncbi:hypothetical protein V5O48_001679 [Marasmius crinis-equi]|uniref:TECPR1-like DysF domain-containing protein n=1 Tax=Marasmius crinis-equi TaxID=585013 RepID=A0ABR3FXR3_9AGAR
MALHDFLNSVPYPLTAVLIRLAPCLSAIRHATEIFSWSTSWYESFLAIAAWWGICLFMDVTVRYLLPIAALFIWFIARTTSVERNALPPITENALQTAIADLTAIQTFIPTSQEIVRPVSSWSTLLRVCASLYVPYLALTHYVPLRIIAGVAGTVALSWCSPWSIVIRSALDRSAWCRWGAYRTWSFLSGQPLPPRSQPVEGFSDTKPTEPANVLRFLFTIYENQRWWMGLDFSAALLPSERPSWSTQSQQAVAPPNLFTLPEDSVVYLPDRQGRRVKRTATWKWEEPEWKVLIKREDGVTNRVEKPLPATKEETTSTGMLMKKMKEMNSNAGTSTTPKGDNDIEAADDEDSGEDEDLATDADGWVYGDNKWENRSGKGGMGKYTRYRRWTRVAIVVEHVEVIDDGQTGIERIRTDIVSKPEETRNTNDETSPLRQRLKSALAKSSSTSSSTA